MIRFGPAGNSESFRAQGYKNNLDVPKYLKNMNLTAFEYQSGRGVKIGQEPAKAFGKALYEAEVAVSIHAPYYISLSSTELEKREKSIGYILQSAQAVDWMGGNRIVVHSGSASKMSREEALHLAKNTLSSAQSELDKNGFSHIYICPETMGKTNQLGDFAEVIELCKVDERFLPCIDFGHLNARTFGGLKTKSDYEHILTTISDELGEYRGKNFHVHFSKIEYTTPGGELRHLTFEDELFGPDYRPLIELCAERGLTPVVICESAGTQAEDSATMKNYFESCVAVK